MSTNVPDLEELHTSLPELLDVTPEIRDLIMASETADVIGSKAREQGFKSMTDWGEILVKGNITSQAEIDRVTS